MAKTPEMITVKIKFDTWIGEERFDAVTGIDPYTKQPVYRVIDLPFEQGLNLLKEGKAERADPIPGTE